MSTPELKRTPLFEAHQKLNAKMVEFGGWEMPVSYKSIIEEHQAVRTNVGIFDIGHMGLVKIEGDDALALIQKVGTNDASKLALNQCHYSILCNESGGVVDDILVYRLPMLYLIVCNAGNTDKVLSWLKKQAKPYKHVSLGLYENYSMLSIQGPQAARIVSQVLSLDVSALKHNHSLWWRDIIVSRTGYTGEDGLELIVAKKEANKLWASLLKAGIRPCGLGARDTLRLEAGLPLYGHEYDDKTSPLEVGYGWAVKFDKGDFIGKQALQKQKEKGVKRSLVGLELEGRAIARAADPIFDHRNSKLVGQVTSGTFSPTLKKPIALAFLAAAEAEPGNTVQVDIRGRKATAKVVAKTFYKR
jgi:aminomethyltransferase